MSNFIKIRPALLLRQVKQMDINKNKDLIIDSFFLVNLITIGQLRIFNSVLIKVATQGVVVAPTLVVRFTAKK
jgi:hypothetical protein